MTLPGGENASMDAPRGSNWQIVASENWPPGELLWDPPAHTLDMANAPYTTAALGTSFAWDYGTCMNATFDGSANAPTGSNVDPGHGMCFRTPDNRLALFQVISESSTQIVLKIEVWQPAS